MPRVLILIVCLAWAGAALAQPSPQLPEPPVAEIPDAAGEGPDIDPEEADISITATVRAREVRFEQDPQVRVEFFGQPERLTQSETERSNLPEDVQPGVTYRDVVVRLKIASIFADIDRIVAEALGEAPAEVSPTPPLQRPQEEAEPERVPR